MSNKHKKQENNKIRLISEKEQEMLDYPDYCYCGFLLGLDADIDFELDSPIGETEPIDGYPYYNSVGYTAPIYKCKRCEKMHVLQIAY